MPTRSYEQYCPVATALDVLGERWTLLILRELLAGPRRYSDLRGGLPGIATNLLSDRLHHLAAEGLIERFEVPPPIARTHYRLTDEGWRLVAPLIGALGRFGLPRLPAPTGPPHPQLGFLAGIVTHFDGYHARGVDEDYSAVIDGQVFELGVRDGRLCAPRASPAALMHASATDLLGIRLHPSDQPPPTLRYTGSSEAIGRLKAIFGLPTPAAP